MDKAHEVAACMADVDAALTQFDKLATDAPPAVVAGLRRRHRDRKVLFAGTASIRVPGSPVAVNAVLQVHVNEAERAEITA